MKIGRKNTDIQMKNDECHLMNLAKSNIILKQLYKVSIESLSDFDSLENKLS